MGRAVSMVAVNRKHFDGKIYAQDRCKDDIKIVHTEIFSIDSNLTKMAETKIKRGFL
jgi:hypothetical protein